MVRGRVINAPTDNVVLFVRPFVTDRKLVSFATNVKIRPSWVTLPDPDRRAILVMKTIRRLVEWGDGYRRRDARCAVERPWIGLM